MALRAFALRSLTFIALAGATALTLPATPARADAGAYLAARAAGQTSDFEAAATWFLKALRDDQTNPALLENALTSLIILGEMDRALPLAEALRDSRASSQTAHLLLLGEAARQGDWRGVLSALEAGQTVGPVVDGLARAWAYVGQGRMGPALSAFDEVIDAPGQRGFGLYHKALALAAVGDFEAAEAIFALPPQEGMARTRRATIAYAQVLSQLGRNADAIARIDAVFGPRIDPSLASLREALEQGDALPFDVVQDAREGMAETLFSVAAALEGETGPALVSAYLHIATSLDPGHIDAILASARLFDEMGQFDLANAAFNRVPRDDPAFHAAELGRAAALRRAGRNDTAIEVLEQLARSYPDLAPVHVTLGDTLRGEKRYREANAAYGRALALYPPDDPALWLVLYTRGITAHELDDWPAAEADFRRSLALNPGQPQVLNYLGYSLVERGETLDEALAMIEQAVTAQPQNGAIVDSLGWVLFRLGRFEEAVGHMERAASLLPVDPIINDHLGDTFWAVGRVTEARFQWQRALSFGPQDSDAQRIRRKLDIGLDLVLAEEGAPPLHLAQEAQP